jgi:hypothetical protein
MMVGTTNGKLQVRRHALLRHNIHLTMRVLPAGLPDATWSHPAALQEDLSLTSDMDLSCEMDSSLTCENGADWMDQDVDRSMNGLGGGSR